MSDDQKPPEPRLGSGMPKKIAFTVIYDMEKGEVQINGPVQQKMLAISAMSHAIQAIINYVPPIIQKPANGRVIVPGD